MSEGQAPTARQGGAVASWWEPLPGGAVHCGLCPWNCRIADGALGRCRVRGNQDGRLLALTYGRVSSVALDPIEKKPLYHFHPGTTILSLGSNGCNFDCQFCQNWQISQRESELTSLAPTAAAALAADAPARDYRCIGIAYTYSEPAIWAEYVRDTARLVHERGLVNVMVTNGYINPEPLAELLPLIDAWNIDVKAFSEDYYRNVCGGRLEPVKETVAAVQAGGAHLEVTTLIVPGHNDSPSEIDALVDWLAALSPEIPLHISRYFPNYRLTTAPTPVETLLRIRDQARRKLQYVHIGNVAASEIGPEKPRQ